MPRRYLCDVLEEMRKCHKTRNFAPMLGLIEEAQTLGNRMEAALGEKKDLERWHDEAKKEKEKLAELLEKTNKLREKDGEKKKTVYGVNDIDW